MAAIIDQNVQSGLAAQGGQVRMTPTMREGLDALQREYDAFVGIVLPDAGVHDGSADPQQIKHASFW